MLDGAIAWYVSLEADRIKIMFQSSIRCIGAEVNGVDPRKPPAEDEMRTIRQGRPAYKVLLFRDRRLTGEEHIQFAPRSASRPSTWTDRSRRRARPDRGGD